jgi:hypothetical protein
MACGLWTHPCSAQAVTSTWLVTFKSPFGVLFLQGRIHPHFTYEETDLNGLRNIAVYKKEKKFLWYWTLNSRPIP